MPYFRDRQIAAPLKPDASWTLTGVTPGFPRSTDRGPVEAATTTARLAAHVAFPRSTDRGPVEARKPGRRRRKHVHFRDRQIAAPLKLGNAYMVGEAGPISAIDR